MALDDQAQQDTKAAERLQAVASNPNLYSIFKDPSDLTEIGQSVVEGYEIDLVSMGDWLKASDKAIALAQMSREDKNYPFEGASNVIFPLITSAALQYNARAYPAIVPSGDIVQCSVSGSDRDGAKADRAKRVAEYQSHQLRQDEPNWEDDTDGLLFMLPIVGHMFRKRWFDPAKGKSRSGVRMPGTVVVNAKAKSLEQAPRISEVIELYPHEIETRKRSGLFADVDLPSENDVDPMKPVQFIEQHCRIDLDDDGYPEPYVVTIHKDTAKVVRVVAAFDLKSVRLAEDNTIVEIEPVPFYVSYKFMPSFDGGFFGAGLGILLGDISDTINTLINQIIDSGHLASLSSGFIGARDFRVKGGAKRVRPGEWEQLNVAGDDIRKGMVQLQFPGPNGTLFEMLGMMIEMGREIASVKDVMTGDASRQMTATTTMALIEQGMMVFSASYKRIFRSLRAEFRMMAVMNERYLAADRYNKFLDDGGPRDPQSDFDLEDMDIQPVADPKAVTSAQKMASSQFLLDMAERGLIDPQPATFRALEAAQIEDPESLLPKPDPMAEQAQQIAQVMTQLDMALKDAQIDDTMASAKQRMSVVAKNMADADATELEAALAPDRARIDEMKMMKEILLVQRDRFRGMAGSPGNGAVVGNPQASF